MEQNISVIATLDGVEPTVLGVRFGGRFGTDWSLSLGELELRFPVDPEERARIAAAIIECLQEIQAEALRRAVEAVAS